MGILAPGEPQFLHVGEGAKARRIAFLRRAASASDGAGLVWLGGFRSIMRGEKASYLDRAAGEAGRAYVRFDYSGHGESEGCFEDSTIGLWLEEALAVVRALTEGPQILIGSSMGGWLALLAARALFAAGESARLRGLVLIAPAVDFTEKLIWDRMPAKARAALKAKGVWPRPSRYRPEPDPISRGLIEEGRRHLLLDATIRSHCPVHILQGMQDEDVPWRHALTLIEHMHGDPATLTLIKDGDHRLSRPEDLARIWAAVEGMDHHHLDNAASVV
ncbi:alpha/beta hydrolase [Methylocella tundrae]|uniref:alpha/beta hydrolase n=1 Tax=Methylocella tundrae TaxID=227605 RepID=UPI001FCEFA6F|nr:alpha/beta hydrolase [Methylocella tundrae]WPP06389.1 alpha/beta hydrolase [Methylocella tundrae]